MPIFPNPENSSIIRILAIYLFGGTISCSLLYSAYSNLYPSPEASNNPKAAFSYLFGGLLIAVITYLTARWTSDSEY